jgi:hypothetical protein
LQAIPDQTLSAKPFFTCFFPIYGGTNFFSSDRSLKIFVRWSAGEMDTLLRQPIYKAQQSSARLSKAQQGSAGLSKIEFIFNPIDQSATHDLCALHLDLNRNLNRQA